MTDGPLISVVIPNWNGAHLLPTCLDALRAQSYPNVEVIVSDNGSTDGSLEVVKERYPEVRVLALGENRGFTGACNAGIEAAQGVYVALLNNDTQAEAGWLEAVAGAFRRHPDAGLVASKMLFFDRRDTLHTAGDYYGVDGIPGNRGVWQRDNGRYGHEEYVFSACGGSAAYRKTMLDEVGALDDDFFYSCEDVDIAWRAQLAGWRCIYTPDAIVYHKLAATGGGAIASYYNGRNFLYVIAKDYPSPLLRKYAWRVAGAQARIAWEALKAWRGEAARARLRGMLAGLLTLPRVLRKRKAIQATRRVPLEAIEQMLTHERPGEGSAR